jgi:hypothetical protein
VIVGAQEQEDLYVLLRQAFARDLRVQVIRDRRRDMSRNPVGVTDRPRAHAPAVIPAPVILEPRSVTAPAVHGSTARSTSYA